VSNKKNIHNGPHDSACYIVELYIRVFDLGSVVCTVTQIQKLANSETLLI